MKICNVILSLNAGGAENAASIISNHFSKKFKVSFLVFIKRKQWPFFYNLEKNITVRELDLYKKSKNIISAFFLNFKRIYKIRKNIKKINPDVIIAHCSREIVLTFFATLMMNKKIIGYIHSDPKTLIKEKSTIWLVLTYFSFILISHCIVFSRQAKSQLPFLAQKKAFILPNVSSECKKKKKNYKNKNIIMVGSLINIKNHSFVINNFTKITKQFPNWTLTIIGDGPLKGSLKRLIKKNNLSKSVFLVGNKKNIFNYFDKASIFLLSSISEGMNLSMLEAAKYGLPIISSDCSSSHKKLLIHNTNGFLYKRQSNSQFLKYLCNLINNENMRKKFGEKSIKLSKKFKNKNILKQWDSILNKF